jgi:Na+/H+ antiporter NhaC
MDHLERSLMCRSWSEGLMGGAGYRVVLAMLAYLCMLLLACGVSTAAGQVPGGPLVLDVEGPAAMVTGVAASLTVVRPDDAAATAYVVRGADGMEIAAGLLQPGTNEVENVRVVSRAQLPLRFEAAGEAVELSPRLLPDWVSVVPPLLAIALALILKEVIVSLFAGVWLGAFLWTGLDPFSAFLRAADSFALPELADSDHAAVILFTLMIGGMVGVIARNGGTHGIVARLAPYATSPRRGLFATYVQGLAIFFDDYANALIVGNTMRPITDRLRVSREKLAYVVDSTSAPVASIMFVSTWVGYEISLIASGLEAAAEAVSATDPGMAAALGEMSAFNVFLDTIPYRFYPLLALFFVLAVIWSRRDFGPMYTAEARARAGGGLIRPGSAPAADVRQGELDPPHGARQLWWNAVGPVLVVVLTVMIGLYVSGLAALGPGEFALRDIIGEANPFQVLIWASLLGSLVAVILSVGQRILTLRQAMDAWLSGTRSMVLAIVILVLAWSLARVTEVLGTAEYISSVLGENVPVTLLPALVFMVAAAISFATGTSWGTMAILLPLVIPLGAALTSAAALAGEHHYTLLLGVISSVLAGSIFGDHCSPISDTTVMSSVATACDHVDHVRTQLPYALLVGAVGIVVGDIPTAYGLSPWISLAVGVTILLVVLRIFGRRAEWVAEPTAGNLSS